MLLRWLVNQYLRDAAEGKVREVISGIGQSPAQGPTLKPSTSTHDRRVLYPEGLSLVSQSQLSASGTPNPTPEPDFLPCDVVFIFALGVESGGLADLLK